MEKAVFQGITEVQGSFSRFEVLYFSDVEPTKNLITVLTADVDWSGTMGAVQTAIVNAVVSEGVGLGYTVAQVFMPSLNKVVI